MRLRQEGLIWRNAGDEVIALDLARSEYLAGNATAAVIWRALADGVPRERLVELLCARFEVEAEVAGADVDRVLSWLASEGLLEGEGDQAIPQPVEGDQAIPQPVEGDQAIPQPSNDGSA